MRRPVIQSDVPVIPTRGPSSRATDASTRTRSPSSRATDASTFRRLLIQDERPVIQSERPVIQSDGRVDLNERPLIQDERPVIQSERTRDPRREALHPERRTRRPEREARHPERRTRRPEREARHPGRRGLSSRTEARHSDDGRVDLNERPRHPGREPRRHERQSLLRQRTSFRRRPPHARGFYSADAVAFPACLPRPAFGNLGTARRWPPYRPAPPSRSPGGNRPAGARP